MIRTLIAEANSTARLGMRAILGRSGMDFDIDEAASGAELAICLAARYYELIVIDPLLCEVGPEACIAYLRETAPWSAVLVYTALDELIHGRQLIRHGAKGYLMKDRSADEFVDAVKRVGSGRIYLSGALAAEYERGLRRYDSRIKPHKTLNQREFEVFAMAVGGWTVAECATVLELDVDTIKAFMAGVIDKLQLASADAMPAYARAEALVDHCREVCGVLWSNRFCVNEPPRPVPALV